MKAEVSAYIYLAFVVMIGIIAITVAMMNLDPLQSPEGRSLEIATKLALYIDSLSSVDEGRLTMDMGEYKYNIEVQKKDSLWRSIGRAVLPNDWIDKRGYYLAVTPYIEKDDEEKEGDTRVFAIVSYNKDEDHVAFFEGVSSICVVKESEGEFAEVKKCA